MLAEGCFDSPTSTGSCQRHFAGTAVGVNAGRFVLGVARWEQTVRQTADTSSEQQSLHSAAGGDTWNASRTVQVQTDRYRLLVTMACLKWCGLTTPW